MTDFQYGRPLNPIDDGDDIIIKRAELYDTLNHLQNEDRYIALCSPRHTGKTTLLYQIQEHIRQQGNGVAYLDLSGFDDLDKPNFYQTISKEITEEFTDIIENNTNNSCNPNLVNNQIDFSEYLKCLSANTPKARQIVIIMEGLNGIPQNIAKTFFPKLRGFFTDGTTPSRDRDLYRKVKFIFSGTYDLQLLLKGNNSPLRGVCKEFTINDFSLEQTISLAHHLQSLPSAMINDIGELVYKWCSGHPYLTQRLYALIDKNPECQTANVVQMDKVVESLINQNLLYSNDINLSHIVKFIKTNKKYADQVFNILDVTKLGTDIRTVINLEELLINGCIKCSTNQSLVFIRNKIYEKALRNYFTQETQQ